MRFVRLAFTTALVVLAGTVMPLQATAATLKIATVSPEGSSWMKVMRQAAKDIKETTNGRVKVKFHSGGVMGDDKAVLRKMRVGQLQGAALAAGSLTQLYTDVQLYNLPMVFRDYAEVDYVREHLDPVIEAGIEAKGYEVLGFAEGGFAYAMSTQRATSVAAAQALKVWVPDADPGAAIAVKAFGIAAVPLTIADVLAGLQTGLVDAVAIPPVATLALQWHTQLHYVLDLPLLYVYGTVVLDRKAFRKVSADDQELVRKRFGEAMAEIDRINRKDNQAAMLALQNQGIELLAPTAEELAIWQKNADGATATLVSGGTVTQPIYDRFLELIAAARSRQAAAAP